MRNDLVTISLAFIVISSFALGQSDRSDEFIKIGWENIKNEQYDLAIENFDKAISINSSSYEAWHGKGYAINGLGGKDYYDKNYIESTSHFNEAKECFEKAIQLNSSDHKAYRDLAWTENMLNEFETALELVDKALEISPNDTEAIIVKGSIRYRESKYREAAELYHNATEMDPTNPDAWYSYCFVLSNQFTGDPKYSDETEIACKKSAELNTGD
jgi:tetratricopeptide (TPR) repeat protein